MGTTIKTPQQALKSLQRTCSRMERSKSDIEKSLYRFGISSEDGEKIIASLERDGFGKDRFIWAQR